MRLFACCLLQSPIHTVLFCMADAFANTSPRYNFRCTAFSMVSSTPTIVNMQVSRGGGLSFTLIRQQQPQHLVTPLIFARKQDAAYARFAAR